MPGSLIQPAQCLRCAFLRKEQFPKGVFREVISGLCGQSKPPLGFFMIPHGGEVVPVELTQLVGCHRISLCPELLQLPNRFRVFLIQRIDILQHGFGGTVALCLIVYAGGSMFLLCFLRLRLVLQCFIFKSWEAETDVLGLPDDVVLDSAKLPLLGEREMLPWCAAAVALVQLVPDLIPDFVALRYFRLSGQLIHDGVHQRFQWLFQIAILLFPGGGFQSLHQLAHLLLDDGVVAELVIHPVDQLPHGVLGCLDQIFVGYILPLVDLIHLIPEDSVGQLGAHGRNAFSGQEALLGIVRPDHHVDMGVMSLIVEGCVPAEVIHRYPHSPGQILCVHHEQSAPRIRVVVFQAGGIFPAQGVDDGPHISFMGLQLGHGCIQVNCRSGAEQAVCAVTLHTRTGGNVGHVSAL